MQKENALLRPVQVPVTALNLKLHFMSGQNIYKYQIQENLFFSLKIIIIKYTTGATVTVLKFTFTLFEKRGVKCRKQEEKSSYIPLSCLNFLAVMGHILGVSQQALHSPYRRRECFVVKVKPGGNYKLQMRDTDDSSQKCIFLLRFFCN